ELPGAALRRLLPGLPGDRQGHHPGALPQPALGPPRAAAAHRAFGPLHRLRQVRTGLRAAGGFGHQGAAAPAGPGQGRRPLPQGLGGKGRGRRLADRRPDPVANTRAGGHAMSRTARKSVAGRNPTAAARETKGWLGANRVWLWRRASQLGFLGLFLRGPISLWLARDGKLQQAWWPVKGNLASSVTLDTLPLTDPYMLLQGLLAGHLPETAALLGALIVLLFYGLIGGRMYCSWFCPINPVTDAAGLLRLTLKIKPSPTPPERQLRWLLLATLLVSLVTGGIAWEWVNPNSMLHRALIFGAGAAWGLVAAVFLYDLLFAA